MTSGTTFVPGSGFLSQNISSSNFLKIQIFRERDSNPRPPNHVAGVGPDGPKNLLHLLFLENTLKVRVCAWQSTNINVSKACASNVRVQNFFSIANVGLLQSKTNIFRKLCPSAVQKQWFLGFFFPIKNAGFLRIVPYCFSTSNIWHVRVLPSKW